MSRVPRLSPRASAGLALAAVLAYALAAWFLVVAPKRSEAARLGAEVAQAEIRLLEARAAAGRAGEAGVRVSEVLSLARAMPSSADQASLLLELSRLAQASGVALRGIAPQEPATGAGGARMIPVTVSVHGGYFQIARFLRRVRSLVTTRGGELRARGRLFVVQHVELAQSTTDGFPKLDATVTLNAYVYDGPIAPAEQGTPAPAEPETGATAAGRTP
ncbi:MAG TPA: type 4a pilus biogenesis protein PilO [Gaiellaceae bacterium]|nr:type 4a pilus biogenesis protein PilO [Gaiellaceae bacterium]